MCNCIPGGLRASVGSEILILNHSTDHHSARISDQHIPDIPSPTPALDLLPRLETLRPRRTFDRFVYHTRPVRTRSQEELPSHSGSRRGHVRPGQWSGSGNRKSMKSTKRLDASLHVRIAVGLLYLHTVSSCASATRFAKLRRDPRLTARYRTALLTRLTDRRAGRLTRFTDRRAGRLTRLTGRRAGRLTRLTGRRAGRLTRLTGRRAGRLTRLTDCRAGRGEWRGD